MTGLCECGCGQKTSPARQTDAAKGWIRGRSIRFLQWHHQRLQVSRESLEKRFWRNVKKTEGCWLWVGSTKRGGYGQLQVCKHNVSAHRFSYELVNGSIPKNLYVCHNCDNPCCVRPDHLFLGTHKENMQDARSKGRTSRGFNLPHTKLSETDVLSIRRIHRERRPRYKDIAKVFGVSPTAIGQLIRHETFAWVKR